MCSRVRPPPANQQQVFPQTAAQAAAKRKPLVPGLLPGAQLETVSGANCSLGLLCQALHQLEYA